MTENFNRSDVPKHSRTGNSFGNRTSTPGKPPLLFDVLYNYECKKEHPTARSTTGTKNIDRGSKLLHLHPAHRRIAGKKRDRDQKRKNFKFLHPDSDGSTSRDIPSTNSGNADADDEDFFAKIKLINELREKGIFIRASQMFSNSISTTLITPERPSTDFYPIMPESEEDRKFLESRMQHCSAMNSMILEDNDDGPDYGNDIGEMAMSPIIPEASDDGPDYGDDISEISNNENSSHTSPSLDEHDSQVIPELAVAASHSNDEPVYELGFFEQAVRDKIHNDSLVAETASLKIRYTTNKFSTDGIPGAVRDYVSLSRNTFKESVISDLSILNCKVSIPRRTRTVRISKRELNEWSPSDEEGILLYAPRGFIPNNISKLNFFSADQFCGNSTNKGLIRSLLKRGVNIITHSLSDCDENTPMLIPPVAEFLGNEFVHTFVPIHVLMDRYEMLKNFKAVKFKIYCIDDVVQFLRSRLLLYARKG